MPGKVNEWTSYFADRVLFGFVAAAAVVVVPQVSIFIMAEHQDEMNIIASFGEWLCQEGG